LKVLPKEEIVSVANGVWNLSSDQGNLGTAIVTNVRVVWYANMNDFFNISIPYIQIASVRTRDSKFGMALVIESSEISGGYVLGFRVDPQEKLEQVYKEISSLHKIYSDNPIFGVEYSRTDKIHVDEEKEINESINSVISKMDEVDEIDENHMESNDAFAAYVAEGGHEGRDRPPVYCPELGLAIEQLKDGYTLDSLWQILPPETSKKNLE